MPTFVFHPDYYRYHFGPEHPFSPVRQEMLLTLLEALDVPLLPSQPSPASREALCTVHDAAFVDAVAQATPDDPATHDTAKGLGTADVPVFAGMHDAARLLVGGTLHAATIVASGKTPCALQLGGGLHHGHAALASGFCVYNDLSVAIHHLRQAGLRVAYLDVDVHHGDGVQALHYDDPEVLTLSLHETGRYLFPGTGRVHEVGRDAGKGYSLNVPLEPFTEDDSYLDVFERVVPYALDHFQPDVLLVQCGADAHFSDPLADLLLTTHGFERLFRRIIELTDEHAGGQAVFTLGGGYAPDATVRIWALLILLLQDHPLPDALPADWVATWSEQLGAALTPTLHDAPQSFDSPRRDTIASQNTQVSKRLLELVAPAWYQAW
ncbi:MAG: acetoin utilization protein AcuC [Bacteroidetes bacterium]|jgi:acetoin utilization protein AcuC|nr:acetoin utilization protein AcuC [Bacteroidota bacterium]